MLGSQKPVDDLIKPETALPADHSRDLPIFSAHDVVVVVAGSAAAAVNTAEAQRSAHATHITGAAAIASVFADALCRERSLTDKETELVIKLNQYLPMLSRLRRWSADEDEDLLRLVGTMPAQEIGLIIGRSPWAVRSRLRNLRQRAARV